MPSESACRWDQVHPVELQGELDNGGVALGADPAQDLGHRLVHIGAGISRAREEVIEGRLGATEIEQPEGHERLKATGGA